MQPQITLDIGDEKVLLDGVAVSIATYMSWARKIRVYATFLPFLSYRGHGDASWSLLPTLARQPIPVEMMEQIENDVIEEFRNRFDLKDWNNIEVLAYARHCGAPTRLLDWTANPFVALWFAVSERQFDHCDGVVFQFAVPSSSKFVSVGGISDSILEKGKPRMPVHIMRGPGRIERTERQKSIFSIAKSEDNYVVHPLDEILKDEVRPALRKFPILKALKPELRRVLSELSLDAYSLYGDADSFGKSLSAFFEFSDFAIDSKKAEKTR